MNSARYAQYTPEQMILRDHLAVERTALANERTLLAYVRTMIGIVAVGGTLVKLFEGLQYHVMGWSLMGLGFVVLIIGFNRYVRIEGVLSSIEHEPGFDTQDKVHQMFWGLLTKLHVATVKHQSQR